MRPHLHECVYLYPVPITTHSPLGPSSSIWKCTSKSTVAMVCVELQRGRRSPEVKDDIRRLALSHPMSSPSCIKDCRLV